MDFTLHQLQVFGKVAKLRSMTKAAEAMHMTQPAVSIQIKQLQESLDIALIEIVGKKLCLTQAGEELYRLYQNLDEELDIFNARISQLKGGLTGQLTISAASTAKYFLPYLLGVFKQKYPAIDISLKVTNRDEVLRHLRLNEYDLAILTQVPENEPIEATPFLDNPFVMCAPPDHPLSGKSPVHIKEVPAEAFVYREPGSGTRMVMEKYLQQNGIAVNPVMELGTNEAVKQAIMAGIGISLISRLSLTNELQLGKISILDIEGFPLESSWHTLHRKEKKLTPVTENFIAFLHAQNLSSMIP